MAKKSPIQLGVEGYNVDKRVYCTNCGKYSMAYNVVNYSTGFDPTVYRILLCCLILPGVIYKMIKGKVDANHQACCGFCHLPDFVTECREWNRDIQPSPSNVVSGSSYQMPANTAPAAAAKVAPAAQTNVASQQAAPANGFTNDKDIAAKIDKIKKMYEKNQLTEEEATEKINKLLGNN